MAVVKHMNARRKKNIYERSKYAYALLNFACYLIRKIKFVKKYILKVSCLY